MPWPPVIPPAGRVNSTPQLDNHPSDHNAIVAALADIVARVDPTPWTALAFGTGWSNVAGAQAGQYRKVGDIVYMRGTIQCDNTATHTQMAIMPSGFRPPSGLIFNVWAFMGSGALRVDLNPDGTLVLSGGLTGALAFLSLIQIIYPVTA